MSLQEEDDENLYTSIQRLRDRTSELSNKVSLLERLGSGDLTYQQSAEELRAALDQLSQMVEARNHRLAPITHAHAINLDEGHQDQETLYKFLLDNSATDMVSDSPQTTSILLF